MDFISFFELASSVGIEEAVAFAQLLATLKGLPFLHPCSQRSTAKEHYKKC